MKNQPKIAVVTGASRGIGSVIAQRLAAQNAHVVVNFNRDEAAAEQTVRAIEKAGGQAWAMQADLSDFDQIAPFFERVASTCGGIDWLVNNAGHATFAPLSDVSRDDYNALFDLNVRGVFFATQAACKYLRDNGRIVNISSGITRVNASGGSVYAATKSAVEAFTRCWAAELGARGITVNTVSPGMTETDLLKSAMDESAREKAGESVLLGRLGQPADIADVVAFLCSDAARWLTAQNLLANGGAD